MADSPALIEFKQGMRMLRDGHPNDALVHFRAAADVEMHNPYYMSFVGVSLARAEKKWEPALSLCEAALRMKRTEAQLHLNLAEVYVAAGRREEALLTLDRAAASVGRDARVQRARQKLGSRRSPVLPFVSRANILNRKLGILRQRVFDWAAGTHLPLLHSAR
jgi:Flp pilus assembly protein TadD